MGTSAGYSLPTSGNWPDAKREVTAWVQSGTSSPEQVRNVLRTYVSAQGGAAASAQATPSANRAAAKLGGILSGIRSEGLDRALADAGLENLIGKPASEVMSGIADYLIEMGALLDDELVKEAFNDLYEEVIEVHDSYEELDIALSHLSLRDNVAETVERFFGYFVFRKFKRDFSERVLKIAGGVKKANRLLRDIKEFIFDTLRLQNQRRDVAKVNWRGQEGLRITQEIHESVWRVYGES